MTTLRMAFCAALFLASIGAVQAQTQIMAPDADQFIGRTAMVCGKVAGFRVNTNTEGSPGFFYFENNFPRHEFAVRIDGNDLAGMAAIHGKEDSYVGKTMCAQGDIRRGGGGRPEIQVSSQSNIKLGQ